MHSTESKLFRSFSLKYLVILAALLLLTVLLTGQEAVLPNLHLAALQGNADVIRQHIEAGSDLDAVDRFGSYPLNTAITFDRTEAALELIKGGSSVDVTDQFGSTPLHLAALFGRVEVARALIGAGANKYALTNNGATPYDMAAAPFDRDHELYQNLINSLGPFGFELDMTSLPDRRQQIAQLLRPTPLQLSSVDLTIPPAPDWPEMEPVEAGIPEDLIAELFYDAQFHTNLQSLMILKNGHIVAEKYFNGMAPGERSLVQSISKSYFAALVGIALERGCIESLDQKMIDFFPDLSDDLVGTSKAEITVRDLLEMRAGYPWEELDSAVWRRIVDGDQYPLIADVALVNEPGEEFNYSNLSTFILGIITSRACAEDLSEFALQYLLEPIGSGTGEWYSDSSGNYYPFLSFSTRELAIFGQLCLDEGMMGNHEVIAHEWIDQSLGQYSPDAWIAEVRQDHVGRYLYDLDYGYQWWSADISGYRIPFAWGHGGQLIFLLRDQDMVVVVTSDPKYRDHGSASWKEEQSSFNLIGKFLTLYFEALN